MTLKDRCTFIVVAIDKHDIFTFTLTIFKLHTDVDFLPILNTFTTYIKRPYDVKELSNFECKILNE